MSIWSVITVLLEIILILIGFTMSIMTKEKLLRIYFIFMLFTVVISTILANFKMNNLFTFHIETVVVFIIFNTLFYYKLKLTSRRVLLFSIISFIAIELFSLLTYNKIDTFNVISRTVSALWFIVFSIYYYYKLLSGAEIEPLKNNSEFWYVTGILIYYIGNFFLFFTFNNIMYVGREVSDVIWNINNITILILYTLLIQGMSLIDENKEITTKR